MFIFTAMSLFIASLNSGSNGNCYYVGNEQEAVLVDVGISCREVEKRMKALELSLENVKGIFISHEHVDHIRGVARLSKKYQIPVYITSFALKHAYMRIEKHLHVEFRADEPVEIGDLSVVPFTKLHDASDPYSFLVESRTSGVKVGVITDIGRACEQVVHYFRQCHACFLESNYDEKMLRLGDYPPHLKKRITGGKGHLSNDQAVELFLKHRPPFMSHLILSHLSENNNHPELALAMFTKHNTDTTVIVAPRYKTSDVFKIDNTPGQAEIRKTILKKESSQLALFN